MAQITTAKYYNKKHKDMSYNVRDEVLLSSRNIRTRRACKKLNDRFISLFRVMEKVSRNTYKLNLLKRYERLHRTFGVILLEPYQRRKGQEPPEPVEIDDEKEWLVDSVLKARKSHDKRMFLVR
jgi:hypothetical protein